MLNYVLHRKRLYQRRNGGTFEPYENERPRRQPDGGNDVWLYGLCKTFHHGT